MNWGFFTICVLLAGNIGMGIIQHGQSKKATVSVNATIASALVEIVLILWAMHWKF